MYIWLFSRSVGAGNATTRNTRGLTRSVIALIVPPLPAPSRPSKTTQTLSPLWRTHCWSLTSSTWSFSSSSSYFLRLSFLPGSSGVSIDRLPDRFFTFGLPLSTSSPSAGSAQRGADRRRERGIVLGAQRLRIDGQRAGRGAALGEMDRGIGLLQPPAERARGGLAAGEHDVQRGHAPGLRGGQQPRRRAGERGGDRGEPLLRSE